MGIRIIFLIIVESLTITGRLRHQKFIIPSRITKNNKRISIKGKHLEKIEDQEREDPMSNARERERKKNVHLINTVKVVYKYNRLSVIYIAVFT